MGLLRAFSFLHAKAHSIRHFSLRGNDRTGVRICRSSCFCLDSFFLLTVPQLSPEKKKKMFCQYMHLTISVLTHGLIMQN
jgi:hypothetical protein